MSQVQQDSKSSHAPAVGPNALRKADCVTLSLSTQADTCIKTISKRETITLVLTVINKNVLLPMENLISVLTLIFIDLEKGGGILFLSSSQKKSQI